MEIETIEQAMTEIDRRKTEMHKIASAFEIPFFAAMFDGEGTVYTSAHNLGPREIFNMLATIFDHINKIAEEYDSKEGADE